MQVRDATAAEIPQLAQLWLEAWRDGHEAVVPASLTALRTRDSFESRLRAFDNIRVVGEPGAPQGFSVLKGDELHQIFVAAAARGSAAAPALIDDAEQRLAARGVRTAFLICTVGNTRAARFYEKRGWHLTKTFMDNVETSAGPYALEVWRYEKSLPLAP